MSSRRFLCAMMLALGTIAATTPDAALPPGVPYASPTDPVRIASIELPTETLHGGDVASARVITTSNAAALTARIGSYQVNVPRIAPGTFVFALKVPRLPLPSYWAHVVITAIRADGATAQRTVSVRIRY